MKRIVILIDGTWGQEGSGVGTNVAQLDPANRAAGPRLIIARGADGLEQRVMYHAGVGADPDLLKHLLGGSIGLGLKQIVLDAYSSVVKAYEHGDDIFALGFFKGCICCAGTRGNDRSFGNRAA